MSNLDKFGKLITQNLRDSSLNRYLSIESGKLKSKECMELSEELSKFSEAQLEIIKKLITNCIDTGLHDFLFAIEEIQDELEISVNGEKILDSSDGLQGEIFTEDGWLAKFSNYGEDGI